MPDLERMNSKEQDTRPVPAPRLRFPGFVGEWEQKELGEVAGLVSRKVKTSEILATDYISTENILPDFLGVERTNKKPESGNITKFSCGDVLVSNIRPYLRKVWAAEWEGGASNDVLVFRASGQLNPEYFVHLLRNDKFIAYMMQGAKGLKMPRGDIQKIKEYPIPLPSLPEQTRIAAALSSLDAVIAAHQSRQDALREHKRGLMAGLFPAEGERVPRLRFPEFEGAGEWEEKKLGEVVDMQAGKFIAAKEIQEQYADDLFPCYGGNGIRGYVKQSNYSGLYSLIGRQGALCGNVQLAAGEFYATEHALVVHPKKQQDTMFFFQYLDYLELNQYATGQAQPGLSVDVLKKVEIINPPSLPEQTRIAACLSSLDSLIAAQGDHIAALQTFKRGLMQGLFPSTTNHEAAE